MQSEHALDGSSESRDQRTPVENNTQDPHSPWLDTNVVGYEERQRREESAILREALFIMQGISGDRLKLQADRPLLVTSSIAFNPPLLLSTRISGGGLDALKQCGEAGWLYSRIRQLIREPSESVIVRAVQEAANDHLQRYLQFLSQFELVDQPVLPAHSLTLRRLLVQSRSSHQDLQSLAMVLDGVMHLPGPEILTALSLHMQHGNTRHVQIVETLLRAATVPWMNLLYLWVSNGTLLVSSANEFFVAADEGTENQDLWRLGYVLHLDRVPTILSPKLVDPAFQIGKSVNYIRRVLEDGSWKMNLDEDIENGDESSEDRTSIKERYSTRIERIIHEASLQVHPYIMDTLRTKYFLMDHIRALKQFLLLGQGDFFSALMDGLHAEYGFLDEKSRVIYQYNVSSIVDTALQNTNASSFEDEILGRLQVTLLRADEHDSQFLFAKPKQDTLPVWEIFCLDYTLPDPLVAIVDAASMKDYRSLFLFLFSVRRVEYMLNVTWRQSAVLHHALQSTAQTLGSKVTDSPAYAQAHILLRNVAITRQAMTHFILNFKNYLFFEVLEDAWMGLLNKMELAPNLDQLIDAHTEYLAKIKRKSMMPANDVGSGSASMTALGAQLRDLLILVKVFCDFQTRVFASALQAADRASEKRRIAFMQLDHGSWGFLSESEFHDHETFFGLSDAAELEILEDMSGEFDRKMKELVAAIDFRLRGGSIEGSQGWRSSPDDEARKVDMDDLDSIRFLKFQLACNGFYS